MVLPSILCDLRWVNFTLWASGSDSGIEGSLWAWSPGTCLGLLNRGKTRPREGHTGGLESLYGALETQPQKEGPLQGMLWGDLRGDPRHRGTSTQPVSSRGGVQSRAKLRPASSQASSQVQPLRPPLWVTLETAEPPHPFLPLTSTLELRLLTSSSLRPRGVLTPFPPQTPTPGMQGMAQSWLPPLGSPP